MYGIDKKIRYHHMVDAANYSSASKTWTLKANANGTPATFTARFMLLGTGYYDYHNPLETDIPGLKSFKGQIVHPQFWPADLDYTNKDVVVIGSGATAVTVLPIMCRTAKHVTMLQRSPGYIVSIDSEDALEKLVRFIFAWSPAIQQWIFRVKWILTSLIVTTLCAWFPRIAQKYLLGRVTRALPKTIKADPHFSPKYYPWQQVSVLDRAAFSC